MKSSNKVSRVWVMPAALLSSAYGCNGADDLDAILDAPISEQTAALSEKAEDTDVFDVCTKWCKDCPTCNIYCCELTLEDIAAAAAREDVEKPQSFATEVSARGAAPAPATGDLTSEEPTEEACTKICKTCEQCEPFCCQATSFEDLL